MNLREIEEQRGIRKYNQEEVNVLNDTSNFSVTDKYYPVISDDVLSLFWLNKYNEPDINLSEHEIFDIIFNETKEKIGNISFNYLWNSGFSYSGNVGYSIKEQFRNRHYATRALKLLKELLKQNEYRGDKDLYISTTVMNEQSQKVALNNDGELYYDGSVPKRDPINFIDGIKEVKVYKIKL